MDTADIFYKDLDLWCTDCRTKDKVVTLFFSFLWILNNNLHWSGRFNAQAILNYQDLFSANLSCFKMIYFLHLYFRNNVIMIFGRREKQHHFIVFSWIFLKVLWNQMLLHSGMLLYYRRNITILIEAFDSVGLDIETYRNTF